MVGFLFVIVGVLWLLQQMGYIVGDFWQFVWPIIIILVGLSMIENRRDNNKGSFQLQKTKK